MPYWVKRIRLKDGDVVTEKELRRDENYSEGDAPIVGNEISVSCRGRTFRAKVIWGNWPGRITAENSHIVVPLRVEEL